MSTQTRTLRDMQEHALQRVKKIGEQLDDPNVRDLPKADFDRLVRDSEDAVADLERISAQARQADALTRAREQSDVQVQRGPGARGGDTLGRWLVTQTRALVGASGSGSYVVPEVYWSQVWDRLAANSVGLASGFTVVDLMDGTGDTLHIPRTTADAAAAWVSEAATISATDPTMSEVVATPRKLAALVQMSNEVLRDSNPSIADLVMRNLLRSLALKLDLGFFEGSGSAPEIRGLKNVAGIGAVSMGTNGATPTNLDPFADAIGTLAQANAEASAIVMHPRTWQTLLKLKEQTSSNNKPLLQESAGAATAGVQRSLYGVPVFLTSQLSITETQGTSVDASSAYVYQASEVVAVRRFDTIIEFDNSRLFNSDQSEVRAIARWDLVVPNPTAVVRIAGIRP